MTEPPAPNDRLRAILVLVGTAAVIIYNFLASAGYVNRVTPEVISDKYLTPVTPAGYAFSIWSLIYLGMAAFSIYQLLPSNRSKFSQVRTFYVVSCALNIGWIYFWHHDEIVVCFIIIFLLAITLFLINSRLTEIAGTADFWVAKAPFGLYFGWLTAATLVNLAVMLIALDLPISSETWTAISVILILIAAALGVWMRIKQSNYLHAFAIAWALSAIAVKQSGNTLIVIACAAGVVACLIAAFSFVTNLPTRPTIQPTTK